jgi:hypothetical protein
MEVSRGGGAAGCRPGKKAPSFTPAAVCFFERQAGRAHAGNRRQRKIGVGEEC